jgi:hypothetical protein
MRRWPILLLAFFIALIGGRYVYGIATRKDDATLIRQALADAIKASKEGRPGGVLDKLSSDLKLNDQSVSLSQMANAVKTQHPDVEIANDTPIVAGDEATITSDVTVKMASLGGKGMDLKNVKMTFRRETAMEWLVIPTQTWHLKDVHLSELPNIPGFGGE